MDPLKQNRVWTLSIASSRRVLVKIFKPPSICAYVKSSFSAAELHKQAQVYLHSMVSDLCLWLLMGSALQCEIGYGRKSQESQSWISCSSRSHFLSFKLRIIRPMVNLGEMRPQVNNLKNQNPPETEFRVTEPEHPNMNMNSVLNSFPSLPPKHDRQLIDRRWQYRNMSKVAKLF